MKKRIISMLLAIFMVVGMLPTVVFAADVVAGGTCGASGASVNWVLDSDGVLTISGEGKMTNYNLGNSKAPWSDYKSSLKKVVIESGVTKIGNNAFNGFDALTEMQLPATLTEIGTNAIKNCPNLSYVEFWGTSNLEKIGNGVFSDCNKLECIYVPTTYEGDDLSHYAYISKTLVVESITPTTYTLKWMVGDMEYKSEELEEGAAITVPEAPTKAAAGCTTYAFDKWDSEIPESMPAKDLTFTAVFTETTEHKLTYTDNGDGTHSASCVCGEEKGETIEHTFENHLCQCGAQEAAYLYSYSLSLKGNIAINYYMHLAEEILADETAFMRFTLADGQVIEIPVSQAIPQTRSSDTYYVFSCAVDAKEMTDVVKAQFFYGDCATQEYGYNVQSYAEYMLENETDEKLLALVKALLHYGSAAQTHFGYNTGDLADAELEAPDYSAVTIPSYDVAAGQGTENVKFHSAALILKSETTLRFFFTAPFTAEYNGNTLEVKERNGLYYVDVIGISAKDLDENVTIAISDGENTAEVTYNPMAYCAAVQADATGAFDQKMKNLVTALYLYNQAANMYLEEN